MTSEMRLWEQVSTCQIRPLSIVKLAEQKFLTIKIPDKAKIVVDFEMEEADSDGDDDDELQQEERKSGQDSDISIKTAVKTCKYTGILDCETGSIQGWCLKYEFR